MLGGIRYIQSVHTFEWHDYKPHCAMCVQKSDEYILAIFHSW